MQRSHQRSSIPLVLSLFFSGILLVVHGLNLQPPQPHGSAWIDYSAVNDYYHEHYGSLAGSDPYFPQNHVEEPIFNARQSFIQANGKPTDPSLHTCGFTLLRAPTAVTDWSKRDQLNRVYLPELRNTMEDQFGRDNILYLQFFHPMLRGEDLLMTSTATSTSQDDSNTNSSNLLPTSPTAAMAHIDNDIGAFERDQIVGIVEKNSLRNENTKEDEDDDFPREALLHAIHNGHRFLVVNAWRNAGTAPIRRAPLGLYAVHYNNNNDTIDTTTTGLCFPAAAPNGAKSRWYVYPDMAPDECLLFKQYDRDARYVSDIWHCALKSLTTDDKAPPRRSLDVRAFVILKEKVPEAFDRYSTTRIRPKLTYEESKTFCRSQGKARQQEQSSQEIA